jgi:nicotinate-nucleotide adenylyltransferase
MNIIGIFGGTFDPVHCGHLRAASEVRERLELSELRLMPAGSPPHRSVTFASAQQRLAMLRLALTGQSDLVVDDREVRRAGFSYMVDTLEEVRREEGAKPLLLIIGQDAANILDTWHEWQQLFRLTHIVIMRRPNSRGVYSAQLSRELQPRWVHEVRHLQAVPAGRVLALEVTQLAISSTDIRQQIAHGLSPRFLLPDPVLDYIYQHGLYR